jgi:predicted transposase YbfD/YdcC
MDGGNDYVIQVKVNQLKLFDGIETTICKEKPIDQYQSKEINKGRKEIRRVRLYRYNEKYISSEWKGIKRIVEIINSGIRDGRKYSEKHYYISSLTENKAEAFAKGIREHWSIENKLHRVKDVFQNEDNSLIVEKRIAANLSLIKSVAISVFRLNGHLSIKKALEQFKNQIPECIKLIGIKPILKN